MEAIVGIIVGTFALYVGYKRLAFVGALFNRRAKLERIERALRQARENAHGPSPWRVATERDRELVALLAAALTDERSLEALGFQRLGDLVGELPGQPATLAMRVLVKDATVAGVMVTRSAPSTVRISLSSYGADRQRTTSRGGDGRSLAMPPWIRLVHMNAGASVADLLSEHTAFAPADERVFATLDDSLAHIATQRERVQHWRDAQPPDELLEADLRGLLGAQYERAGAYWTRKLRAKLPDATLRRR